MTTYRIHYKHDGKEVFNETSPGYLNLPELHTHISTGMRTYEVIDIIKHVPLFGGGEQLISEYDVIMK